MKEMKSFYENKEGQQIELQRNIEHIQSQRVKNERAREHFSEIRYNGEALKSILEVETIEKDIERRRVKSRMLKRKQTNDCK
jgi:hypothetical protein